MTGRSRRLAPAQKPRDIVDEALLVGREEAVRRAFVFDEMAVADAGGGLARRRVDRHRLVFGAMQDQRRHLESGEIAAEIVLAEMRQPAWQIDQILPPMSCQRRQKA